MIFCVIGRIFSLQMDGSRGTKFLLLSCSDSESEGSGGTAVEQRFLLEFCGTSFMLKVSLVFTEESQHF